MYKRHHMYRILDADGMPVNAPMFRGKALARQMRQRGVKIEAVLIIA